MKRCCSVLLALFLSGCLVDSRTEYYENGKIKSEAEYRSGKMFGMKKVYYESGELLFEGTYEYDAPMGQHRYYYPNGKPRQEIEYIDGRMDGVRRKFDDRGVLRMSATFTAGTLNDDCTEFSGPNSAKRAEICDFDSDIAGMIQ